jgi:hypothetical protein
MFLAQFAIAGTIASTNPFAANNPTCTAFSTWEKHPTRRNLDIMFRDSKDALHFIRIDAHWVHYDETHRVPALNLAGDLGAMTGDCADYAAAAYG